MNQTIVIGIASIVVALVTAFITWKIASSQLKQDSNKIIFERKINLYLDLIKAYRDVKIQNSSDESRQNFVMLQQQVQLLCSKDIKTESERFFTETPENYRYIWEALLLKMKEDLKI